MIKTKGVRHFVGVTRTTLIGARIGALARLFLFVVCMSGIILIGSPGIVPFGLSRWEAASSSSSSQQTVLIGAAFVIPVVLGCGRLMMMRPPIVRGRTVR